MATKKKLKSEEGTSSSPSVVNKTKKRGKGFIANSNIPSNNFNGEQNGPFWIEERRKRVAEYYLAGKSQWEIAKLEDVDQQLISKDLVSVRNQWRQSTLETFDEIKDRELAKYDNLERIATEAWVKSCGVERVVTAESYKDTFGSGSKKKIVRKQLNGDPRYLDQIRMCIEARCKIFGISKEQKPVDQMVAILWDQITGDTGADAIEKQILELEAQTTKEDENVNSE